MACQTVRPPTLDSAGAPPPAPDDDREAWARVHVELGHVELELAEAAMLRAGSRLALMRTSLLKLCVEGIPRARGAFETTEHGQGLRIEELLCAE